MTFKTNDRNPTTKTEASPLEQAQMCIRAPLWKSDKIQISDDVAAKLKEIDPDPNMALRKLLGCHDDRLACAN